MKCWFNVGMNTRLHANFGWSQTLRVEVVRITATATEWILQASPTEWILQSSPTEWILQASPTEWILQASPTEWIPWFGLWR